MTPVEERLRRQIALAGPISVAEFMAACVSAPDGYYARREAFGEGGDFVTAPQISGIFGELLGAFLVDRWNADGRPDPFDLVELGPGNGTLMADVLRVADAVPRFRTAARVVLVEASDRLRQVQRDRLAPLHPRVAWMDRVPTDRPVYLLANEFLDALPIRQFVRRGGAWFERTVGLADGRLAFGLAPFPVPFAEAAPEGAVREIRPAADALVRRVAEHVAVSGAGAALFVDYGYDGPGHGDTLQAVRGHAHVDVLDRPGESDLSAHVDFPSLAAAAREAGAAVHGPVGQGRLLVALGLLERAGQLGANADDVTRKALQDAVHRLAGEREGEMGTLFKALALTARDEPVPGFIPAAAGPDTAAPTAAGPTAAGPADGGAQEGG